MSNIIELIKSCSNVLPGHSSPKPMKQIFLELSKYIDDTSLPDRYGQEAFVQQFEKEMCELFGKESSVFLPSGTMAQQIALRIHTNRTKDNTVAMHPLAHPITAEHASLEFIQNIKRIQFGSPEFLRNRIPTCEDFKKLKVKPACILLELPFRPLGGILPAWDDLFETTEWAQANGIPIHLDGARIWQTTKFYHKSLKDIVALFDSVYVSFYKDIGALNGAMLLGNKDFINEARVWQRRMGGNVYSQSAAIVSSKMMVEKNLPVIGSWVDKAQKIATILNKFDTIETQPLIPQVNFFRVYIRGDPKQLMEKHDELAKKTGTFLFYGLSQAQIPSYSVTEIHCWENSMEFDLSKLKSFIESLLL